MWVHDFSAIYLLFSQTKLCLIRVIRWLLLDQMYRRNGLFATTCPRLQSKTRKRRKLNRYMLIPVIFFGIEEVQPRQIKPTLRTLHLEIDIRVYTSMVITILNSPCMCSTVIYLIYLYDMDILLYLCTHLDHILLKDISMKNHFTESSDYFTTNGIIK